MLNDGLEEGLSDGLVLGLDEGLLLGLDEGLMLGLDEGADEGIIEGSQVRKIAPAVPLKQFSARDVHLPSPTTLPAGRFWQHPSHVHAFSPMIAASPAASQAEALLQLPLPIWAPEALQASYPLQADAAIGPYENKQARSAEQLLIPIVEE